MTDPHGRLGRALQYSFRDPGLLVRALSHRSIGADNYERLEFLGDGLINFVVAEALFRVKPDANEGDLSRLRASLVCEESLAGLADGLGLGDELRLGPGELKSGGFRRQSILADSFEAILGAVYLDGGFDAARDCCQRLFARSFEQLPDPEGLKDSKTRLQEFLQGRGRPLPVYELASTDGPPHQQVFLVECSLADDGTRSQGNGGSRKVAEQCAAERMLEVIGA